MSRHWRDFVKHSYLSVIGVRDQIVFSTVSFWDRKGGPSLHRAETTIIYLPV